MNLEKKLGSVNNVQPTDKILKILKGVI